MYKGIIHTCQAVECGENHNKDLFINVQWKIVKTEGVERGKRWMSERMKTTMKPKPHKHECGLMHLRALTTTTIILMTMGWRRRRKGKLLLHLVVVMWVYCWFFFSVSYFVFWLKCNELHACNITNRQQHQQQQWK